MILADNASTAANIVQSIAGGIGSSFIVYISVVMRRGVRKFMGEHDWLIEQTRKNTEAIKRNQEDIRRVLTILEKGRRRDIRY